MWHQVYVGLPWMQNIELAISTNMIRSAEKIKQQEKVGEDDKDIFETGFKKFKIQRLKRKENFVLDSFEFETPTLVQQSSGPALPDAPSAETYVGLHVIAPIATTELPHEAVFTTNQTDHFTLDPIDNNIKYSQNQLPENLNHYVSIEGGHESKMIEKPLDDIQYLSLLSKANKSQRSLRK